MWTSAEECSSEEDPLEAPLTGAIRLPQQLLISCFPCTLDYAWKHLLQLQLSVALWELSHTDRLLREHSMMGGVISWRSKVNTVWTGPRSWEAQQSVPPPCIIKENNTALLPLWALLLLYSCSDGRSLTVYLAGSDLGCVDCCAESFGNVCVWEQDMLQG